MTTAPTRPPRLVRADGTAVRALIVDDEASLTELLSMAFRTEGWETRTAGDGPAALKAVREFVPDVIVLDVMMPNVDGLEVLKRIRASGNHVPVLFLTAKDAVDDRIAGITAGAEDYVTKPFSLEEVVARMRGIVRRNVVLAADDGPELRVGDLTLNEETYEVNRAGTSITLTATEFELLRYLMRNPKRVLSKAQILDRVWNYDFGGRSSIVEIYISYLRKKIDSLGEPMFHTIRGVGYSIKPAS